MQTCTDRVLITLSRNIERLSARFYHSSFFVLYFSYEKRKESKWGFSKREKLFHWNLRAGSEEKALKLFLNPSTFSGMLLVTLKFKFKDFQQLFAVSNHFSVSRGVFCDVSSMSSSIIYARNTIFGMRISRISNVNCIIILRYFVVVQRMNRVWKCYWKFIRNSR